MVSTGDRSAKIRTYNYPQGRITDHRINYTIYNLSAFMDGDIQDCIDHLIVAENAERLKEKRSCKPTRLRSRANEKDSYYNKVFHTLTEAFQNCLRRFPSTVCFVLALTAYLVYLVATTWMMTGSW